MQKRYRTQLELLAQKLSSANPQQSILLAKSKQHDLHSRLVRSQLAIQDKKQQQLAKFANELNIVSPLATIARGYSITRDEHGKIVKSAKDIKIGETLTTQLDDAQISSTVTKVDPL